MRCGVIFVKRIEGLVVGLCKGQHGDIFIDICVILTFVMESRNAVEVKVFDAGLVDYFEIEFFDLYIPSRQSAGGSFQMQYPS